MAAGARECLAKPCRLGALVGRLEALLREAETETAFRIGDMRRLALMENDNDQ